MDFGWQELLIILAIVVLLFGATRLPMLGKSIGQSIRGFRSGLKGDDRIPRSWKKADRQTRNLRRRSLTRPPRRSRPAAGAC